MSMPAKEAMPAHFNSHGASYIWGQHSSLSLSHRTYQQEDTRRNWTSTSLCKFVLTELPYPDLNDLRAEAFTIFLGKACHTHSDGSYKYLKTSWDVRISGKKQKFLCDQALQLYKRRRTDCLQTLSPRSLTWLTCKNTCSMLVNCFFLNSLAYNKGMDYINSSYFSLKLARPYPWCYS